MIESTDPVSVAFVARAKAAKTYQELVQITEAANTAGLVLYRDPENKWHCYTMEGTRYQMPMAGSVHVSQMVTR